MTGTTPNEALIWGEVERLFGGISARRGELCENPVTGGEFVYGFDPIKKQKKVAHKRLLLREYVALNTPADAPLIPTDDYERNRAKYTAGLIGFITAQYGWSIESRDDWRVHPSFADFASGMLWQHDNEVEGCSLPRLFPPEQFVALKKRFPPRKLEGLLGFRWRPPRRQKHAKETRRAA
jgi:hypothetical protein